MSRNTFEKLVLDAEFMRTLYGLFKYPTSAQYEVFRSLWERKAKELNVSFPRLRVNRVVAAFTTNVSCFCDENQFANLLANLRDEGLLCFAPLGKWFNDNQSLIHSFNTMLDGETGYDEYTRGVFFWWLWSRKRK